jgi:hypothetical protein
MYCVLSEDVALVMVDIHCQAVSLGLAPQCSTEDMMLVQRISARVLFTDKALGFILLKNAISHPSSPP